MRESRNSRSQPVEILLFEPVRAVLKAAGALRVVLETTRESWMFWQEERMRGRRVAIGKMRNEKGKRDICVGGILAELC